MKTVLVIEDNLDIQGLYFEKLSRVGYKVLSKIPAIVTTNLNTEKHTALSLGANDYLLKASTDLDKLVEKIQKNVL